MTDRPALALDALDTFERPLRLRMPFRFGVVTLSEARQLFVRATVRLADGRAGKGVAAELLVPKWFDKSPERSNEDNETQLRTAVALAAEAYAAAGTHTAFGLHVAASASFAEAASCLPPLAASFGPALVDRAILDALCRLEGVDIFDATRANLFDLTAALAPDLENLALDRFLAGRLPAARLAVRHTVGLVDPLTDEDVAASARIGDGLPETLEEVVAATGVRHFKLKVSGEVEADVARLSRIAAVLEPLPEYAATLDGNEQFADVAGALALWRAIEAAPALARLARSIIFIEQPLARRVALEADVRPLAALKPVEIDESDASTDAFPRARALGYEGVSSKSCKGFYRALLNAARCAAWNAAEARQRYFMSAEDLTTQAGIAVQQDLALATLVGATHAERNGHHYVDGMAGAPRAEQEAFVRHHPDLYRLDGGRARLRIAGGCLSLASLRTPGLASAVVPSRP